MVMSATAASFIYQVGDFFGALVSQGTHVLRILSLVRVGLMHENEKITGCLGYPSTLHHRPGGVCWALEGISSIGFLLGVIPLVLTFMLMYIPDWRVLLVESASPMMTTLLNLELKVA